MDFPKSVPGVGLVAGRYVDENQATGQPGTLITAQAMNALTDEILAVVEDSGMDPDEQDNAQLRDAIKAIVGRETEGIGGLPRFTPYVWGGQAAAMPEGDTQSSGQQLTDLMYPTMRAQVTATQFTCTEAVWQADPYKRVTHWSLGDGASWMRPPDKNGVQPGSVEGGFYGSGVGSSSPLLGAAVLDQMQSFKGKFSFRPSATDNPTQSGGNFYTVSIGPGNETDVAIVEADGNGAPRLGKFTRPRTWYGIWMIRMYGRVTNAGDLNAPALNARMDLLAAGLATLDSKLDSVILYPNGTAAAPANAAAQARYVVPNPFPGFHVSCVAEIKIGANWGATNWHFDGANNTSYGINAEVFGTAAENIVVQVGKYLLGNSINGGDPFGNVSLVTTAPFRIVVKKMKGAM